MKKIHAFSYYGGKYLMLAMLLTLMPVHQTYCEVFGGSGVFLMNKPAVKVEVYNDLNSEIVHFFRTLRNEPEELIRLLEMTPYARDEFKSCKRNIAFEKNDIEKARKFYVRQAQSFAGRGKEFGMCDMNKSNARTFINKMETLRQVAERLRNVHIENTSFEKLIPRFAKDKEKVFIYLDPPYLPETRVTNNDYEYEMTIRDHERLLEMAVSLPAKFLISGYSSELYEKKLKGWNRIEKDVPLSCASKFKDGKRDRRTEILWWNYEIENEKAQILAKLVQKRQK